MPRANSISGKHRGWHYDGVNGRLAAEYNGTEVFDFDANDMAVAVALTAATTITSTAGNFVGTAGNVKLGSPPAFGTTQPVAAVVMGGSSAGGTAPAGAIVTSGAVFASDTVVRKIIADGTASNIET